MFHWVRVPAAGPSKLADVGPKPEVYIVWTVTVPARDPKGSVRIASNCAAEVWAPVEGGPDNGFVGFVGDRCDETKVYSREFACAPGSTLVVRMHWIINTRVTCLQTKAHPFLWMSAVGATVTAAVDLGFAPGAIACSQKPRQAALFPRRASATLLGVDPMPGDTCGKVHVVPAAMDPYALRRVPAEDLVVAFQSTPLPASGKGALQGLDASNEWAFRWPAKKLPDGTFMEPPCVYQLCWRGAREGSLTHTVLRLPQHGLYRVEVITGDRSPCVVAITEVWDADKIAPRHARDTKYYNRYKTALATYVGELCRGRVFGVQGGRYLHIFQDADSPRQVHTNLAKCLSLTLCEYPFQWDAGVRVVEGCEQLLGAVGATIKTCMMDVPVDTPWREATGWLGDLCVYLEALQHLVEPECFAKVARHACSLAAATYNPSLGMMAAIFPVPAHGAIYIVSYHLRFCLLVAGLPAAAVPHAVRSVVKASVRAFLELYEDPATGLVTVPGVLDRRIWHFVDWSAGASARGPGAEADRALEGNAVINALLYRVKKLWGRGADAASSGRGRGAAAGAGAGAVAKVQAGAGAGAGAAAASAPAGGDADSDARFRQAFVEAFHCEDMPGPYCMTRESREPSLHATVDAILAGLCTDVTQSALALAALLRKWGPGCKIMPDDHAHGGPTFFYGGFVADALRMCEGVLRPRGVTAASWVKGFYEPMAIEYGTIPEKKTDTASLAHAWSVGITSHIVTRAPAASV